MGRLRVIPLVAALLIAVGCGDDDGGEASASSTTTTTSTTTAPAGGEDVERTIRVGSRDRTYVAFVPDSVEGADLVPVIMALHGRPSTPGAVRDVSGLDELAMKEGIIAVYPWGVNRGWNASTPAAQAVVDDVAFLRALIEDVAVALPADPERVYVTGFSNGGFMAHRAGCDLADVVAGVAAVGGLLEVPCQPSQPVSVVMVHGDEDRPVPYDGGGIGPVSPEVGSRAVPDVAAAWARLDGCATGPTESEVASQVRESRWDGCGDGTVVVLRTYADGGHIWPDDATDAIWAELSAHRRAAD